MNRRRFLRNSLAIPAFAASQRSLFSMNGTGYGNPFRRVRPGDPNWPSPSDWNSLKKALGGRLIKLESPLDICKTDASTAACDAVFAELKNPYFIRDSPALTQTSGWLNAWNSEPSVYAVAAENPADVAAGINFARKHKLRLVVKGGGHSYQGTSNAPDSLLIWTRAMDKIELHEAFIAKGCESKSEPQPAVSLGSGCIWMHTYDAVTTKAGRYVQGGGCGTVGVAGLIQSGGFGSFSKKYGIACAALLEAEIVTADGKLLTVNECNHPDLFWALKGGGGGSFGVITKLVLRTREIPEFFGTTFGRLIAKSEESYKSLVMRILDFYREALFNPHWGEQIRFHTNRSVEFQMLFQGITQQMAQETWQPFLDWVKSSPDQFEWMQPLASAAFPARHIWDPDFLKKFAPQIISQDNRPGMPDGNIFWKGNEGEAGQFLWAYKSAWLSSSLLDDNSKSRLVDSLINASRMWTVSLHFNKGLAGAPPEEIMAAKKTATNPAVLDAFALVIIAGEGKPAFLKYPGHEPDLGAAKHGADKINQSMDELQKLCPSPASYLSETDFFQSDWQKS
ncbi:MAG: FAD-binding oxidoreductase, partial [Chitinophagales bacterium]